MPVFGGNVNSYPKKVCKAISKRLNRLPRLKTKPKKTDNISRSNISYRVLCKAAKGDSLFIRLRTNHLNLTCINGEETSEAVIDTIYCCFVRSPFVKTSTLFVLSEQSSYSSRLVIRFVPMQTEVSSDIDIGRQNISDRKKFERLAQYDLSILTDVIQSYRKMYKKYIPIVSNKNFKMYPRTKIDYEAPMCWLDIQGWYTLYQEERHDEESDIRPTKSDTTVNTSNTLGSNISFTTIKHEEQNSDFHKRFTYPHLAKYLLTASSPINERRCEIPLELFIEYTKPNGTAVNLLKLKTELLVKCFETFFYPYGESMVAWVPCLTKHIPEEDEVEFQQNQYKAILKMSEPASVLLRHREVSLLDTICTIIGIGKPKIKLYFDCINA